MPRSYCILLCPHGIPLGKRTIHRFYNLFWLVVFDLGVDVHRDFATLMACQILNRFRVNRGMNQIGYVGVPKLVRCDLEIQAVNTVTIIPGLLSQLRVDDILHVFPVYQLLYYSRFRGPRHNVLLQPLKLCVGQRITVPVGYHIVRGRRFLCLPQTLCQAGWEWNIPLRCFGF